MADDEKSSKPSHRELTVQRQDRLNATNRGGAGAPSVPVPRPPQQGISVVPFSPRPPFDPRLVFTDVDTERAAAFRLLRQRLFDRGDAQAVLCTSPNPGEGKTTLAANLALALSETGMHRVLLLEANFRDAALADLFGFEPPKGLRTQINSHRDRPDDPWILIQIGPPPLFILAAEPSACPRCTAPLPSDARFCGECGTTVTDLPAFFDGAGFAAAVQRFRRDFDYIIIDAPSVLAGGDVNLIQGSADAVIMSVRKGRSDERSLRRAVDQIAPLPIAGVTMFED